MINTNKKKQSYLSNNLSFLMAQHAIDIKNLSIAVGIPAATISRLKQKGSNPTLSTLEPILEFFRLDMDTFLYEDISSNQFNNKKSMGELIPINVYDIAELSNKNTSKISHFISAAGITNPNTFGVNIKGDSLIPIFSANSIVIIDPDLKPVESDYVLCILGDNSDESPVFRQIFMDGGNAYFKPINPNFGDMKLYEKYNILGVIIKSIETYR